MKHRKLKILNICMAFLTILFVCCAVTVTGSGFLDLSNLVRYFFEGCAIITCLTFLLTYRKAWMHE